MREMMAPNWKDRPTARDLTQKPFLNDWIQRNREAFLVPAFERETSRPISRAYSLKHRFSEVVKEEDPSPRRIQKLRQKNTAKRRIGGEGGSMATRSSNAPKARRDPIVHLLSPIPERSTRTQAARSAKPAVCTCMIQ
mmetsp:Transcript_37119/g.71618  ORF Transcript_37119/g.71618 Transcript_37119/m.71618 type:complete len:138 (+) Transcript_37119:1083-1496(+)